MSASTAIKVNDKADVIQHYCTPPWAVRHMIDALHILGYDTHDTTAYDPAAGQGHILHAAAPHYADIKGDDLIDYAPRYYTPTRRDYLTEETPFTGHVIMNPPFTHYDAFVRRARWNGASLVACLIRVSGLAGFDRMEELYAPHRPAHVLVHSQRVHMEKGAPPLEGNSAMDNIWVVWAGKVRTTTLHWLRRGPDDYAAPGDYFDTHGGKRDLT